MRDLLLRIRSVLSLTRHYRKYCLYENKRKYGFKSPLRIYLDQLHIIFKNGYIEPFYLLYGFQSKQKDIKTIDKYLNYHSFQKQINFLNLCNPYFEYHARVITADKFYFYCFCKSIGIPVPEVISYIRNNQCLYGVNCLNKSGISKLFKEYNQVFVKPCSGQMGEGSFILNRVEHKYGINNNSEYKSDEQIVDLLQKGDWIVQALISQHPNLQRLYPDSVNTIRLQTVMDADGNVHPFGAILRVGRNGNVVDNWAKGGILVGIDMEKGALMKYGFIKPSFGTIVLTEHPDTKVVFYNYPVPYFREAVLMAIRLHKNLYRCHSIGWDISITPEGPIFIEGNGLWEISMVQIAHGGMKDTLSKYFSYDKKIFMNRKV